MVLNGRRREWRREGQERFVWEWEDWFPRELEDLSVLGEAEDFCDELVLVWITA